MKTITMGNFVLKSMSADEYNKKYCVDVYPRFGQDVTDIMWIAQYDDNGNYVAMSEELMLIFADGTMAYTSRGVVHEATMSKCFEVISCMEEF